MFTLNLRVISGKPSSDFPCSKSALKHLCSSAVVRPVVGDKMCKGPDKKKNLCVIVGLESELLHQLSLGQFQNLGFIQTRK